MCAAKFSVNFVLMLIGNSGMDIDAASTRKSSNSKRASSGRIQKKKASRIVFPKYKDSKGKKKKA